jgi:hypothetical protein
MRSASIAAPIQASSVQVGAGGDTCCFGGTLSPGAYSPSGSGDATTEAQGCLRMLLKLGVNAKLFAFERLSYFVQS